MHSRPHELYVYASSDSEDVWIGVFSGVTQGPEGDAGYATTTNFLRPPS